jgi:acetyl esterase/lipase
MTAEDVARKKILVAQAAVLSYPAVDLYDLCLKGNETKSNIFWTLADKTPRGFLGDSINTKCNAELYKAVSPVYNIPKSNQLRLPPQLCIVGSNDNVVKPESVQIYVSKLKDAGQPVEYWEYEGRPHAFLDSKANQYLRTVFYRDAPAAIDQIIEFLNRVFRM